MSFPCRKIRFIHKKSPGSQIRATATSNGVIKVRNFYLWENLVLPLEISLHITNPAGNTEDTAAHGWSCSPWKGKGVLP